MGRTWGLSESNPDVTKSSLWLLLSCEGHAGGRRRREHRPRSSLERDEHWSVVGLALARWRNAPAGRRSLHSGSRSAWGTQLAATPEGGGSGSGGAAAGSGPGRPRLGRRGGLGDSGPLGSRRATRASAETMAKEEGDGCSAPTAAAGSGEGPGPGCGPRGAGRAGARGENGPKFRLPEWGARWSLKLGVSERKPARSGGAAGPDCSALESGTSLGGFGWELRVQPARARTPREELRQGSRMDAQKLTEFTCAARDDESQRAGACKWF